IRRPDKSGAHRSARTAMGSLTLADRPSLARRVHAAPFAEAIRRAILGAGLVLVAAHCALELTWHFHGAVPAALRPLLMAHEDQGILSWLTIATSAALGLACVAVGALERRRGWHLVGALFLFLSMDDATMLHERVGWLAQSWFDGVEIFAWVA